MRHLAGSLCSLGLGVSAFCHAVMADTKTEQQAPDALVFRTPAVAGQQHFAVAIRSSAVPAEIRRHVILIDTSASQTGRFRDGSIELLTALIERLPAGHLVKVAAVDTTFEPLTDGFQATGSAELKQSVKSLASRTPMGATDLTSGLRSAFAEKTSEPMSVLYIGDGISAADQLSLKNLDSLVDDLLKHSVSFHALLLGPSVDTQLPGVLANQTGGTFEQPVSLDAIASAERLAHQMSAAPVFVKDIEVAGSGLKLAAGDNVALRADRHTVLFGQGSPSGSLTLSGQSADGSEMVWTSQAGAVKEAGEEVRVLFARAAESDGLNTSVVGLEGLASSSQQFQLTITDSIAAAERFQKAGQKDKALAIVRNALLLDAGNATLTGLATALQDESPSVEAGAPMPADEALSEPIVNSGEDKLGPPSAADGDVLAKAANDREIATQLLVQSVKAAIDEANRVSAEQPEYALTLLKDMLETIRSADVAPEKRNELDRRVVDAYASVNSVRQTNQIRQREKSEQLANREAMDRMLQEAQIEEQRLQTLISQVRGLLDRARHGDIPAYEEAEIAARTALDMEPGNGTASAAVVMSESAGQLSKAYELVNLRADRFLEVLYQVELSHVPFPDEPPIQYPPADVWRLLTRSREKHQSVSLRSEKPVELWLEEMLDKPVDLEHPANTPLEDIMTDIENYFTELGPYTMRIMLDESDPDIGTDPLFLTTTEVPSDIDLKGITLRNALKLIFAKVKDQDPGLTIMIKNEVMMVTTTDTANSDENLITRIYDVADLVVITTPMGGGGGFGGGQGGGQFGGGGGQFGGGGGQFGGGGGGQFGGGGFMSLPPEPAADAVNGIKLNNGSLKKKPVK
ncbi:MAG: hypothetical protein U0936_02335 [Planctomycetaceae bacterium]